MYIEFYTPLYWGVKYNRDLIQITIIFQIMHRLNVNQIKFDLKYYTIIQN